MSAEELNVAVVGAGYWGKNLVRNFAAIQRSRLLTVCDSSTEVLDRMKNTYPGIRVTTDLEDVLGDDEVHAVALVTPAVMHADQSPRTAVQLLRKTLLVAQSEEPTSSSDAISADLRLRFHIAE